MTTSIFSSVRRISPVCRLLAAAVLTAGSMLLTWGTISDWRGQPYAQVTGGETQNPNSLRSILQANFDLATRGTNPGRRGVQAMPRDNSAGLVCNPAVLDRNTPAFRMVLPALPNDRKGVLAALTPEGKLRIIYVFYDFDADPNRLSIPFSAIDWRQVQTRNDFVVAVNKFRVLNPDADSTEPLFQDAGIYQFALLNSNDRDMLDINGTPFWIVAGCVVQFQP